MRSKRREIHGRRSQPVAGGAVTVDDQHRVRLPKDVVAAVAWLRDASESVECLAMLGAFGGLLICPETAIPSFVEVVAKLRDRPIRVADAASEIVTCARLIATASKVVVSSEKPRFSLTLPRVARDLKLVPSAGQTAFLFAAGEILEVWPVEEWVRHVRPSAAQMVRTLRGAVEELAKESNEWNAE